MVRWLVVAALVLASLILAGSAAAEPGDAMFQDAQALVELGPRVAGSDGGRRGEQWVQARLEAMGLSAERFVVGHRETPTIAVFGRPYLPPRTVNVPDATLLVTLPATAPADPDEGRRDAFLLLAHYDTVAGSPGAIDNAAAVSVGLELLRRLADAHRPRDVMVAFTACEETRLAGAHALADGLEARPMGGAGAGPGGDLGLRRRAARAARGDLLAPGARPPDGGARACRGALRRSPPGAPPALRPRRARLHQRLRLAAGPPRATEPARRDLPGRNGPGPLRGP